MATWELLNLAVYFLLARKWQPLWTVFRILAWPPTRAKFDKLVRSQL